MSLFCSSYHIHQGNSESHQITRWNEFFVLFFPGLLEFHHFVSKTICIRYWVVLGIRAPGHVPISRSHLCLSPLAWQCSYLAARRENVARIRNRAGLFRRHISDESRTDLAFDILLIFEKYVLYASSSQKWPCPWIRPRFRKNRVR